jgi:hypothetical protein
MSEPKKTTKPTKETSASDSKKTVGEKKDSSSQEPSTNKSEKTPKSASQSSISHFSSVSTPAYRSGWDNIFGNKNSSKSSVTKSEGKTHKEFVLNDDEIDKKLRQALYETFSSKAKDEGLELPKSLEIGIIEYNIRCKFNKT